MAELQVLEGTWEEIVLRAEELKGHRVRVTVLNGETTAIAPESELSLEEEERLLDALALESKELPVLPPEANSREWIYGDHD
jgi:hypothetical protein